MLISIIVPVYNTAQYLSVCLDSIINQTYKNIEIILVDDGSTDGSIEICKKYAEIDCRVTLIHEIHKGIVEARKLGIRNSKGLYCIFVDSDDWIRNDLLEKVVALTEMGTVDVVNYNMQSINGKNVVNWKYTVPEGIYEEQELEYIYSKMMYDFKCGRPGIIQSLCTKIVKRELLQISLDKVDNRITMGEDAAVVYNLLLNSKKIAIIYDYLYFYRTNFSSMVHANDPYIFSKIYYFQQYMKKIFSGYKKQYRLEEQLQAYLVAFIEGGVRKAFSLNAKPMYWISSNLNKIKGRIVLYGAGSIGRSYYKQLLQIEDVEIVAWVDKNLGGQWRYDRKIEFPDILDQSNFDIILIAIKDNNIVEEIESQLCKYINKEYILWEEPYMIPYVKEIDIY